MTVFICTHGRQPSEQYTYELLKKCDYTGDIILVMDDEDDMVSVYQKQGYPVEVFCKQHYIDTVDIGRLDAKRKAILYAKCYCEDRAYELGEERYCIADDDLVKLRYRYMDDGKCRTETITKNLDEIFDAYFEFMEAGDVSMTSFANVPMFIGGAPTPQRICDSRIPYNFLLRNGKFRFQWVSEMNEDTASVLADTDHFMMMLPFIQYDMKALMAGAQGGMTEFYQQITTAQRITTIMMYAPTVVSFVAKKNKYTHALSKENAFPKLISSACLVK